MNGVKNLSVMRTASSDQALMVIRQTGMDQSSATRWALSLAANILEHAWRNGHEARGVVPDMRVSFRVKEGEVSDGAGISGSSQDPDA